MIWGNLELKKFVYESCICGTYAEAINPASINLRLGDSWAVPKSVKGIIQLGDKIEYDFYKEKSFVIRPGEFILATTIEYVDIPEEAAAFVQGRSSIGRACLSVQNAGYVDPGFKGHITLELKNDGPNCIRLLSGYPVAQLIVMDAKDVCGGYNGKYQGQVDATGSRMDLDKFNPVTHEMENGE